MISFSEITMDHRGRLADILHASYAPIMADESGHWSGIAKEMDEFDDNAFDHFETMGKCVFLTKMENTIVGLASFDPRPRPDHGVVGQNCILPAYRRRGLGRRQIEEILSRFRHMGMRKAVVTTSEHPFFLPARRNYESCGFKESRRFTGGPDPKYSMVEYIKSLSQVI